MGNIGFPFCNKWLRTIPLFLSIDLSTISSIVSWCSNSSKPTQPNFLPLILGFRCRDECYLSQYLSIFNFCLGKLRFLWSQTGGWWCLSLNEYIIDLKWEILICLIVWNWEELQVHAVIRYCIALCSSMCIFCIISKLVDWCTLYRAWQNWLYYVKAYLHNEYFCYIGEPTNTEKKNYLSIILKYKMHMKAI